MRRTIFFLALMLAALLLSACARPWSHPDYTSSKQIKYNYDKDSTECTVMIRDKTSEDKRAQNKAFEMCMESKGWTLKEGTSLFRD